MSALSRKESLASAEALRRGWCPSTLRPMETGDGWLVRLHPPGARLTPVQLRRIAALAAAHGNGLVEISARGNLQIRGVTHESHPALVERLLAERLVDEHDGNGPQRLTLVSPLAGFNEAVLLGLDPSISSTRFSARRHAPPENDGRGLIDAFALAEQIERQARAIPGLPAKLCVIVDDGGPQALDGLACDIRLVGIGAGRVALCLADRLWRGPIPGDDAAAAVETILDRFAKLRSAAPDRVRRLRDLSPEALAGLTALPEVNGPMRRPPPRRAGLFKLAEERFAALIGLPFGRCDATALDRLGAGTEASLADIRLSPWRGLAFRDLDRREAVNLLALAGDLGLITRDDDPRLSVQACAGSPACSRAEAPTMADAAVLAEAAAGLLAQGVTLHVSGCVKACAHPAAADLTLVGRDGRYDAVLGGTTRDNPVATLDLSTLLARLQPGQEIHAQLAKAVRSTGPRG
ncbi:precorrin-3B synthase [Bosea sp. SSUT16]|jgi:precorrin-3B synthase|uniref:Precorrin-3B synthase n=1 Tax=Bosea spartocytisi TaxID=2773451 RepID=A0A927HYF8_9HYPH|nr:precorrin-3B synthase [Bosea spartocytisi]MBD3845174.1 precorrin-3B synthase [Bosea spartocytisi]MCT4472344.1 precorrin-3B synthase [Bosea spartocytisi]